MPPRKAPPPLQPSPLEPSSQEPSSQEPVELTPLPTDEPIELTISSTTRPMIGKPKVKNRVGKPLIGARDLVKTPAFGSARLITTDTNP